MEYSYYWFYDIKILCNIYFQFATNKFEFWPFVVKSKSAINALLAIVSAC